MSRTECRSSISTYGFNDVRSQSLQNKKMKSVPSSILQIRRHPELTIMVFTAFFIYLHLPRLVQFSQQSTDIRNTLRIEFVYLLRVDGYTHSTCLWMDAEWGLE